MKNLPVIASPSAVEQATRRWLERAVIGLNLCPFAKGVYAKGQVHVLVSEARTTESLLDQLGLELDELATRDPAERDTTLLVAPYAVPDFLAFTDLLVLAERLVTDRRLAGVIQIASFHPRFQFAGTAPDDISNHTNRSPYPLLHLLRESSVERAVESFAAAESIFEQNIRTLERLGPAGWAALDVGPAR